MLSVAILTGALGVHGYRSRNRWFFLLHILFSLFVVLCFFALFIHSLVQFNKMHNHVADVKKLYDEHHDKVNGTGNQLFDPLINFPELPIKNALRALR